MDPKDTPPSSGNGDKDALILSLREELTVTNQGMIALNLELEEKMQELELLNDELKSFAYSISHDLRQPLRAIDGFASLLEEDYADRLDDEGRDYMARIRAGAERMNGMIEGLLKLSRATRQEMAPREISLDHMAQNVLQELRARDPGRDVQVEIERDMKVSADAQLMESVVQNLLSNAWKYSAKKSHAHISFHREWMDSERIFVVEDDGAGFDMQQADKLFGVFRRLHSDKEFEGTGIGLATTHRIIRRHGGRIWAQGQRNLGARFMFTIPEAS